MFDARQAKLLQPGEHLTIDGCPGLRLEATQKHRTWTYRYKSPTGGAMRQMKLGHWPAMSLASAMKDWETNRHIRDSGTDPGQAKRDHKVLELQKEVQRKANQAMTVGRVCSLYSEALYVRRKAKGADEVTRFLRNPQILAMRRGQLRPTHRLMRATMRKRLPTR